MTANGRKMATFEPYKETKQNQYLLRKTRGVKLSEIRQKITKGLSPLSPPPSSTPLNTSKTAEKTMAIL